MMRSALLSDPPSSNDMHKYRPSNEFFAKTLGKTGLGIHVAMADGHVRFLNPAVDRRTLAIALLTVSGGESRSNLQRIGSMTIFSLNSIYAKCYAFECVCSSLAVARSMGDEAPWRHVGDAA